MQKEVYEFVSRQSNDPIVEWRTCAVSGKPFATFQSDIDFYDKISPIFNGKKYSIPAPTLCPEERQRRRLSWRNERNLYYRTCDLTGKKMVTMYDPVSPYKVYDQKAWRSDAWNPLEYGRDFDVTKPFFLQFDELMKSVPHSSMNVANDNVNSEFTNYSVSNKNVYMSFGPTENEDCFYGKFINKCNHCVDCLATYACEWCYEGYDCVNCYSCQYLINSTDCHHCLMIENCVGCKYCIGCVGLINQEYCYLNQHIGKEKYDALVSSFFPLVESKISSLEQSFLQIKKSGIFPWANIQHSETSSGDMLVNCKSCIFCFDMVNAEHCKYDRYAKNCLWSQDNVFNDPSGIEYCYETCSTLSKRCSFVFFTHNSSDTYYCVECHNSHNLFACVGLRDKEYCILNKQYSREEYEALVSQIIEHMQSTGERGEFFPVEISPYCYNESVASEYFPLTKDEALLRTYRRKDILFTINIPENVATIDGATLDQDPSAWDSSLSKKVLVCKQSGRPYRVIESELAFYQKMNIGIPRLHPDERHYQRMSRKPRKEDHLKTCDKCGIEMLSVYKKESEFKVYCPDCYNKEIY